MIHVLFIIVTFYANGVTMTCPPSKGIYLMYNERCYSNGSYFRDLAITLPGQSRYPTADYLHCGLSGSTVIGGEWRRTSNGLGSINCDSSNTNDNLRCFYNNNPDTSISLYIPSYAIPDESEYQLYKCCLPNRCYDPTTNIITAYIFKYIQIAEFSVKLSSNISTFPQQYTIHCITTGEANYQLGITLKVGSSIVKTCLDGENKNCLTVNRKLLHIINYTYDNSIDITWDSYTLSDGATFNQSAIGDQSYSCNVKIPETNRTSALIVRVPSFIPSLHLISTTPTIITVSWAPNPNDADGYVVNATSDTAGTVTQQVEGGIQSTASLTGLRIGTTYNISVRAYQDILGPVSNTITTQTIKLATKWKLVSSITELLNAQYDIHCEALGATNIYWLINGNMRTNSILTKIRRIVHNSTILVHPDPLGVSINATCVAMFDKVSFSDNVIIKAPNGPPLNMKMYVINETSLKANWTATPEVISGYVIELIDSTHNRNVFTTTDIEVVISDISSSMDGYTIRVYSYIDVYSSEASQTLKTPDPVINLLVADVSNTTITIEWNISGNDYVTHHNIYYVTMPCRSSDLTALNVTFMTTPYTSTYSYTIKELNAGEEYNITVIPGNVLGDSTPAAIVQNTKSFKIPTGNPRITNKIQNGHSMKIFWNGIDCAGRNGRIIAYIININHQHILTSTESHIVIDHLVTGRVYNVTVAGVNEAGSGPFSDVFTFQIEDVPNPVGALSSIMDTTSAVISWTVPSYSPVSLLINTYEIGYQKLQTNWIFDGNPAVTNSFTVLFNVTTLTTKVTNLTFNTTYVFGVRAYNSQTHGEWTIIINTTTLGSCHDSIILFILGISLLIVVSLVQIVIIAICISQSKCFNQVNQRDGIHRNNQVSTDNKSKNIIYTKYIF